MASSISSNVVSPPSFPSSFASSPSRHVRVRASIRNNIPETPKTILSSFTNLLWGPSLPPGLLISAVRTSWTTAWQIMMSQLAPSDSSGSYTRPGSRFRLDPSQFSPGKLQLYVGLPCPWAHRTLVVRALKRLEDAVPVSVAAPGPDGSWEFRDAPKSVEETSNSQNLKKGVGLVPGPDKANGCRNLKGVYKMRRGGYNGRCTVPMLWDVENKEVVCNESYDIIELLNSGLNESAGNPNLDLSPAELKGKIEEWNQLIYPNVNNGVYRCGFAQSQEAYDKAVGELFSTLDKIEDHLGGSRYLCGDMLTLADVCLFTTLIRFDLVYNNLFKCTKKKLVEYPSLHGYLCDIYQIPGVADTFDINATMEGYYGMLFPLNPGCIKPVVPSVCHHHSLLRPHNRESLVKAPDALHSLHN